MYMAKKKEIPRGLLGQLPMEEQAAAVLLFSEPLCRYAVDGEIHVLFIVDHQDDPWIDQLLRAVLSCGQTQAHTLHLHVVGKTADNYREALLKTAPALRDFAIIDGRYTGKYPNEAPLLWMTFTETPDLDRLPSHLDRCRFVVSALHSHNDRMVESLYEKLKAHDRPSVLVYTGETVTPQKRDRKIRLYHLQGLLQKVAVLNRLGEMAFAQAFHYSRRPGLSMADFREGFKTDVYDQRANLWSCVHIPTKLLSVGINPNARPHTIARQYSKLLSPKGRDRFEQLSWLEHRRWLAEKLLQGLRPASTADLEHYGFENGNNRWRTPEIHNCLLPARPRAESDLRQLPHAEWDTLTPEGIAALPFDPLDKMSLTVHHLAGQKMRQAHTRLAAALAAYTTKTELHPIPTAENPLPKLHAWLDRAMLGAELEKQTYWIQKLKLYHKAILLPKGDLVPVLQGLDTLTTLLREYYSFKDYKQMDDDIVNLLPIFYCKPKITLIKLPCSQLTGRVAAALRIEPEKMICFNAEQKAGLKAFFENRNGITEVAFIDVPAGRIGAKIHEIVRKGEGMYIIDATGADAALLLEVAARIRTMKNTVILTCDPQSQMLQDPYGAFPLAGCMTGKVSLTVDEAFLLMGRKMLEKPGEYDALYLQDNSEALWAVFQKYSMQMEGLIDFLRAAVQATAQYGRQPVHYMRTDGAGWKQVSERGALQLWQQLHLAEVLHDLQSCGMIRNLEVHEDAALGMAAVSYTIDAGFYKQCSPLLTLDHNTHTIFKPMCCLSKDHAAVELSWRDPTDQALYINAKATGNGSKLRIKLKDKTVTEIPTALFCAFLHDLEARHLIEHLVWAETDEGAEWSFFYANGPVRNTLHTKGSCLENYVWLHMARSGGFDDVRSNCFYQWGSEEVSNELDVVATQGLELFFCSCKTSMPNNGHLNEVQSLKTTLGLASRTGMVYAFAQANRKLAEKYPAVRQRAHEMGLPICNAMDDGAVDEWIEELLQP